MAEDAASVVGVIHALSIGARARAAYLRSPMPFSAALRACPQEQTDRPRLCNVNEESVEQRAYLMFIRSRYSEDSSLRCAGVSTRCTSMAASVTL